MLDSLAWYNGLRETVILLLKEDDIPGQLDDLPGHQAELPVLVKNGVQVLDPFRIHLTQF